MTVSDCCGESPVLNSEDVGLCPRCKEHCEYVEIKKEEHPLKDDFIEQLNLALFNLGCALREAEGILRKLNEKSNKTNE